METVFRKEEDLWQAVTRILDQELTSEQIKAVLDFRSQQKRGPHRITEALSPDEILERAV